MARDRPNMRTRKWHPINLPHAQRPSGAERGFTLIETGGVTGTTYSKPLQSLPVYISTIFTKPQ